MVDPHAPVEEVVEHLLGFAQDAAETALRLRAQGLTVSHKGDDLGQALTEADQAISRAMTERFGPNLIEEETAEGFGRMRAEAILAGEQWSFIGDPIDGTRPFSGGLNTWGTMIAACRKGWPVAGVLSLPAWVDQRDILGEKPQDNEPRGVLLVAHEGRIRWAPTRNGRMTAPLTPFRRPDAPSHHVGWSTVAIRSFTLDYTKGLFPFCESASVSDFALLVTGRTDATTFKSAIWDLAAAVPFLDALGFGLYAWPDLHPRPAALIDMFSQDFYAGDQLWLVARNRHDAERLAGAIRRA